MLRATLTNLQLFQSHYATSHNAFPFPEENKKIKAGLDRWSIQPHSACDSLGRSSLRKRRALMTPSRLLLISILLLSLAGCVSSVFPRVMKYHLLLI